MLRRLSVRELEQLLQCDKIDTGEGTLFDSMDGGGPAPNSNRLSLMIGIGGSGTACLREVRRLANANLADGYRDCIKFIAIDTDTGELAALANAGEMTLNLSAPGERERFISGNRSPVFASFVPENYNPALLDFNSASRDRVTGKIKLYQYNPVHGLHNDMRLRQMIEHLFQTDWTFAEPSQVDIFLVTGIAGGTGSGTFQDIAAIAKNACPNHANTHVYGFIMLPDTMDHVAMRDADRIAMQKNSYAALKELESTMKLPFEEGREIVMPTNNGDILLNDHNLPIDYPLLISGEYKHAAAVIAETIVHAFCVDDMKNDLDIIYQAQVDRRLRLGESHPDDSFGHSAIGFAQASIPEKTAILNLLGKVCEAAGFENEIRLEHVEFERAIRYLFDIDDKDVIDSDSLWKKVSGMVVKYAKLEENPVEIDYDAILGGYVERYYAGFKKEQVIYRALENLQSELQQYCEGIINRAFTCMKQYGPTVIGCLYNGRGRRDTVTGLEEDLTSISIRSMVETVRMKAQTVQTVPYPGKLPQSSLMMRMMRHQLMNAVIRWKMDAESAVQREVYADVVRTLVQHNSIWDNEIVHRLEEVYQNTWRFTDLLRVMSGYYKAEGRALDVDWFEEFARNSGDETTINIALDVSSYNWVRSTIAEKAANINASNVMDTVIDDFKEHANEWLSEENGRARKHFEGVLAQCCSIGKYGWGGNGLNLSIKDYFNYVTDGVEPARINEVINQHVRHILDLLSVAGKPSLQLKPGAAYPIKFWIVLPGDIHNCNCGAAIVNSIQQYCDAYGWGVMYSYQEQQSIRCYQVSKAIAISDLYGVTEWEYAYNAFAARRCENNERNEKRGGKMSSVHGFLQY